MNGEQQRRIQEDIARTVRQLGGLEVGTDVIQERLDDERLERDIPNSLYNTIERGEVETAINMINNGINVRPYRFNLAGLDRGEVEMMNNMTNIRVPVRSYHFNLALDRGSRELALAILNRQDFEPNNDQLRRAINDGLSDVALDILNKGVVPTNDNLRDALTNGLDEVAQAIMNTGRVALTEFHVEAAVEGKLMGIAEDIYENNPDIKNTLNDLAPASLNPT